MNVVLCGMMGCGKTTVARVLDVAYGKTVVDTDEEIIKRYGNISDIFSKFGEAEFRKMESEITVEVAKLDGVVISTGGGLVMNSANVKVLKNTGKIIYLRASKNTLFERLKADDTRPLLSGGDAREKIEKILSEREPTYQSVADVIIDTDNLSPDEIAKKIMEMRL